MYGAGIARMTKSVMTSGIAVARKKVWREKQWPGDVTSQTFFGGTHWKIVPNVSG